MLIDDYTSVKDKLLYILDEAEYELNDGISIPGKGRSFNSEERADITGIIQYVRKKVEWYAEKL